MYGAYFGCFRDTRFFVYGDTMPYKNVPEDKWDEMDRCKEKVMAKGHDEKSAIAICYSSIMGGSKDAAEKCGFFLDAFKVEKTEADGKHPTGHYLVVEDAQKPSTWHLRVKGPDGKPDHRLMGAAWAALHGGYRGNTYSGPNKEQAISKLRALYKSEGMTVPGAMKIAGDWELDVLGNPYGPDSDAQYFDDKTEIVSGSEVPVVYYHGLAEGGPGFTDKPIVIGKATDPQRKSDGVWWRVVLDKSKAEAVKVWEAARKGAAVASSGAIEYLSRLEIGGKLKQYSKSIPGRIAIWHMGELSLWDLPGHRRQAHPYAVAVPALKAIYDEAGLPFPEDVEDFENDEPQANDKAAKIAKKNLQKRARFLISTFDE
jgi:hypothetical protein